MYVQYALYKQHIHEVYCTHIFCVVVTYVYTLYAASILKIGQTSQTTSKIEIWRCWVCRHQHSSLWFCVKLSGWVNHGKAPSIIPFGVHPMLTATRIATPMYGRAKPFSFSSRPCMDRPGWHSTSLSKAVAWPWVSWTTIQKKLTQLKKEKTEHAPVNWRPVWVLRVLA